MKKSYLMIAVAALAMVSCAQDDLLKNDVNNGENQKQEQISFASFAEKATRASKPTGTDYYLEDYHKTMVVYGSKKDADNIIQLVFNKVTCDFDENPASGNGTGEWHYAPARYWDKQANYKFAAFAPEAADFEFVFNASGDEIASSDGCFKSKNAGTYTIGGQNLMQTAGAKNAEKNVGFDGKSSNDMDIMVSDFATKAGNVGGTVDLLFKHTFAKLLVAVKAGKNAPANASAEGYTVKITGVNANDFLSKGTYNNGWATVSSGDLVDYVYDASSDASADALTDDNEPAVELTTSYQYFIESLVMPQDVTDNQEIKLAYEILTQDGEGNEYAEKFLYTIAMDDVFASADAYNGEYKYVVYFNINPENNIIKFDAGVYDWASGDAQTSYKSLY